MNSLTAEKRAQVVSLLVEGMSIRAVVRVSGVAKGTVLKLLADLGTACATYHDVHVRNLSSKRLQADEIWAFVAKKDRAIPEEDRGNGEVGSIWTWTAIDADTKLIAGYHVGTRDAACAYEFMTDLAGRLTSRVQLTTDGLKVYLTAVDSAFGADIDYAQLVKHYGEVPAGAGRYSPPACLGAELVPVKGKPDTAHISTSYVERQNLTMRMGMRRFTRLTNGFSKKVENLGHAVALHFMHYNYCRVHQTLRVTPAMAAGLTDRVWEISDLVALMPKGERAAWGSRRNARAAGAATV